jgi:hypothetical protein
MKKPYERPAAIVMTLRPEEKIALCDWPTGYMVSTPGCVKFTYQNLPLIADFCQSQTTLSNDSGS